MSVSCRCRLRNSSREIVPLLSRSCRRTICLEGWVVVVAAARGGGCSAELQQHPNLNVQPARLPPAQASTHLRAGLQGEVQSAKRHRSLQLRRIDGAGAVDINGLIVGRRGEGWRGRVLVERASDGCQAR